ncbi:MAG TPA: hypothetical protein VKI45_11545 [Allosphingosinicella sp.]|nr:hypothetical protein [Allosphingosinicella sp.]
MQPLDDGMMLVRAELCERFATLQSSVARCRSRDVDAQAEGIRLLASAYGLTPVARLAEALARAARDAGACPPSLYLARLKDAIGCERLDEDASQAMLASVSVRLCG